MEAKLITDLRGLSNWVFCSGLGVVVEKEGLIWNVMRSFGWPLGFVDELRASEFDLCPGSSERMSDGSHRGVECENTLLSLAFIMLLHFLQLSRHEITRAKRCEKSREWKLQIDTS